MKKAIVTGGAGFIGSFMSKKLVEEGYYIFILDNLFRGRKENIENLILDKSAELIISDLADISCKSTISKLLKENNDIDLIIHYAAINGTQFFYDKPQEVAKVNSIATYYLMESLLDNKDILNSNLQLLFASTSETYGEPFNLPTNESDLTYFRINEDRDSYAVAKMMSEFYVRLYSKKIDLDFIILRIFNVYGPRMVGTKYGQVIPEFINRLKQGEYPLKFIGSGQQKRSFIYIEDHVNLTWKIIISNAKNEIINLGNDEEVSIIDLANSIMSSMGLKPSYETSDDRSGDHMRRQPDISKLLKIVGDYNFIDLETGLSRCLSND
jgi:nucleoside-diphosphate-sugar epimerase